MTLEKDQIEAFRDALEADLGIILDLEDAAWWAEFTLAYHRALDNARHS